jgi:hypothetical protein
MAKGLRTKRSVGPNIVRAWFDTVLNPLLQALAIEEGHLQVKDWTWRFVPGGLEAIRPIRAYLDVDARENLGQFLELQSRASLVVQWHDESVSILSSKCGDLQNALERSSELRAVYKRLTSPEALSKVGANLQQIFGAYPPEHHLALLAQYIVNNMGELPEYHSTSPLWNRHKNEFLAVLRHRSVVLEAVATSKAGDKVLNNVGRLIRVLKETRLKLSLEHDVPYKTVAGSHPEGVI